STAGAHVTVIVTDAVCPCDTATFVGVGTEQPSGGCGTVMARLPVTTLGKWATPDEFEIDSMLPSIMTLTAGSAPRTAELSVTSTEPVGISTMSAATSTYTSNAVTVLSTRKPTPLAGLACPGLSGATY